MTMEAVLERARRLMRLRHYSHRTEATYVGWMVRYLRFHRYRNPIELGGAGIAAFLSHLAERGRVSASTQNQALSALLFLYRDVLGVPPGHIGGIVRAKRPKKLPVVLTKAEVRLVLAELSGAKRLIAALLVWQWASTDGVFAASGEGHRLRFQPDHRARGQGRA